MDRAASPIALAQVLFRRVGHLARDGHGRVPRAWHEAVRSIARAASRSGAASLDAVAFEGVLTVALPVDAERLPAPSARLARAVEAVTGHRLAFVCGDAVVAPAMRRGSPASSSLARVCQWHLARIDGLLDDVVHDRDPEALHQVRVSLRRVRSAVRAARRAPWAAAALAWVRAFSAAAGPVRDLDVMREMLEGLGLPGPLREAGERHVASLRATAREVLLAALASPDTAALRAALDRALRLPTASRRTVRGAARRRLARELDGLERALSAPLVEPEALHEVRKRARRVRDVVDVLGDGMRDAQRGWRRRLQPLQSALGALHDLHAASALLGDDPRVASLRAAVDREALARQAALVGPLASLALTVARRAE